MKGSFLIGAGMTLTLSSAIASFAASPLEASGTESICVQPNPTNEIQNVCYGWKIWDVDPLPIQSGKTQIALRVMDDAVMYGWLSVADIDITSPVKGSMTVQRRDYSLQTPWQLAKLGKKYILRLRSSEIRSISDAIENSNFWSLRKLILSNCEDGEPVVIEGVTPEKHNIVSQNVACDDGKSGIGPLDKVIWNIVRSRVCHGSDNCEV